MDKRKPKLLDREQLTNYAVRALGGRAHSAGELREKLSRRAACAEDIDVVLAKLREINAIAAGIRTALAYLGRGTRPSVAQATSDEEMFI